MEGIFSLAECVLSRYSNDDDVFSCIRILVKEILDLRETLEFCELQIQQEKSAEPADYGFGLGDKENFGPTGPATTEGNPEDPVQPVQFGSADACV
jgi:hypothetical protein